MSFKENLRDEMEFQDIKPKELSEKTGLSVNTIRNYINGHNALPNVEAAVKIAQALDVSVEYLVERQNVRSKNKSPKIFTIEKILADFSEEDISAVLGIIKAISGKYNELT